MRPPLTDPDRRGRNTLQWSNQWAHRPAVRDLGYVWYMQENRIRARLRKAVQRVIRRKAELGLKPDGTPNDDLD